jgi:autotransporter-associated beta strand protein
MTLYKRKYLYLSVILSAFTGSVFAQWLPIGPSPILEITPNVSTNIKGIYYSSDGNNPASGAVSGLLQSPSNLNELFAGTVNGGVWKSSNGGSSWTSLGDNLASLSIGALTFDQADPSKLWVGFGKLSSLNYQGGTLAGVRVLDTASNVWTRPAMAGLVLQDISGLVVNGNTIVLGAKNTSASSGIWRSTDAGASFQNISSGLNAGAITSLVKGSGNTLYAAVLNETSATATGVYRSVDGGANWTQLNALNVLQNREVGQPMTAMIRLSVGKDGVLVASLANPTIINNPSFTAANSNANTPVAVFMSRDQGANWISLGTPGTHEVVNGVPVFQNVYGSGQLMHGRVLADPNNASVFYISGDLQGPGDLIGGNPSVATSIGASTWSGRLFRGEYNAATGQTIWTAITDNYSTGTVAGVTGSAPHADSRFMMIDGSGNLLQTDDGGIFRRTLPTSNGGAWQSLNGNLQVGEVHTARWNAATHTAVTANQDNGVNIQLKSNNPTHGQIAGGDGGVVAVNPRVSVQGSLPIAIYSSSQNLGGFARLGLSADNTADATVTDLYPYIVQSDGSRKYLANDPGTIDNDPPNPKFPGRPKTAVTYGAAIASNPKPDTIAASFIPAMRLNTLDNQRFALGGYEVFVGIDPLTNPQGGVLALEVKQVTDVARDYPSLTTVGFRALQYGAVNNANALLAGIGDPSFLTNAGVLMFSPNIDTTLASTIAVSPNYGTEANPIQYGYQAALFDKQLGTNRIYTSNSVDITRGTLDGGGTSYTFTNLNGNLSADDFYARRALDHIYKYGVSALVAGGLNSTEGGNLLYTLRDPANVITPIWDTHLGSIPNAPIFSLDYSMDDDLLLAGTLGRGIFILPDVTTYFPEATQLVFGQADNASSPSDAQLVDGTNLLGATFSRTMTKTGTGILSLVGRNALYSGGTYLNNGITLVNADANLGAPNIGVSFNGGTLKYDAAFSLNRPIVLQSNNGSIDTNSLAITQGNQAISGVGGLAIQGGGSYTFNGANSYTGGTLVNAAIVNASLDSNFGAPLSGVVLTSGRVNLTNGFIPNLAGTWDRPLSIGPGNSIFNTNANALAFTGGEIGTFGVAGGVLTFAGTPMTMGANLKLNALWNADLAVPAAMVLRGTGGVAGDLNVAGTLYPGNSPGTLTVGGSVVQASTSSFAIDIDGTGTGTGAGNYSRLVVGNSYTAGGNIAPILRGISGDATNTYSPAVGQGFVVVAATGGVLGSYDSITQPSSGLLAGTRFDTVYGGNTVTAYATPSAYSNLSAAGVATNSNRQQLGGVLDLIRPTVGLRPSDVISKTLYDGLYAQSASSLPIAMDQLVGVGYTQLLQQNFENTKFLIDQTMQEIGNQRRGEGKQHIIAAPNLSDNKVDLAAASQEQVWSMAVGRISKLQGDGTGYQMDNTLGGLLGGMQKQLTPQSLAGLSVAYASSYPTTTQNMGSGPMQNLQVMAYASHSLDSGYFLQGSAGGGAGQIYASRSLSMLNTTYSTTIRTLNAAVAGMVGWASPKRDDQPRLELGLGLNYISMRNLGFTDSGSQNAYALNVASGSNNSLNASVGLKVSSTAQQVYGINWRARALAGVSHEFDADNVNVNATFMNQNIQVQSGSIGRYRGNLGVGISGEVSKYTSVGIDLSNQFASNWNATAAVASIKIAF